ncbi:hypothetical protein F909_01374 [Acinetobacter sp. ANC 3929]|uniref:hypothetical protein n=1 Tax=unclassified Acinetobacter TaxID=196816 RepID=UPI0002D01F6B|nr:MULTISPECIES: hypothetical protein [unclassified Acinetobacter]ENW81690.1 hypothetical protein F909_01374 [Acinetobacter sp. ANC 3929]MCH7353168.1 hypothetical protein [Acinetobacter sp. NIPH 2023]MCH7356849.1 hypothetical protein [Acinetobacter sp. NIPH 1958]MCH7360590.1 hypothetical protein [Acinetobacter sp. NIPH 2024]
MSVSSGLYIKIVGVGYNPIRVLEIFHKAGWNFDDHGLKAYLPVHDNGNFDWFFDSISVEELFLILNEKNSLKELIGVVLTWEDSNIGGEFLLDSEGKVTVSLSINRCMLSSGITDVNWYLEKIIPFIQFDNLKVENIKFEEQF